MTSKPSPESLEALAAGDKAKSRWAVFEQINSCRQHGATTDEAADALGLMPHQVSGRMLELKGDGFIVPLLDADGKPTRRRTRTGSPAAVYVARQFAQPLPKSPPTPTTFPEFGDLSPEVHRDEN